MNPITTEIQIGPYVVRAWPNPTSPKSPGHEVQFPDGRKLRVLPDGKTSIRRRSHVIVEGVEALNEEGPKRLDPVAYLMGLLIRNEASELTVIGQEVTADQVISDWLDDWGPDASPTKLLQELASAGFTVVSQQLKAS